MRQMYTDVAITKMTYAADMWYMLVYSMVAHKKKCGEVGFMQRIATVQRMA